MSEIQSETRLHRIQTTLLLTSDRALSASDLETLVHAAHQAAQRSYNEGVLSASLPEETRACVTVSPPQTVSHQELGGGLVYLIDFSDGTAIFQGARCCAYLYHDLVKPNFDIEALVANLLPHQVLVNIPGEWVTPLINQEHVRRHPDDPACLEISGEMELLSDLLRRDPLLLWRLTLDGVVLQGR